MERSKLHHILLKLNHFVLHIILFYEKKLWMIQNKLERQRLNRIFFTNTNVLFPSHAHHFNLSFHSHAEYGSFCNFTSSNSQRALLGISVLIFNLFFDFHLFKKSVSAILTCFFLAEFCGWFFEKFALIFYLRKLMFGFCSFGNTNIDVMLWNTSDWMKDTRQLTDACALTVKLQLSKSHTNECSAFKSEKLNCMHRIGILGNNNSTLWNHLHQIFHAWYPPNEMVNQRVDTFSVRFGLIRIQDIGCSWYHVRLEIHRKYWANRKSIGICCIWWLDNPFHSTYLCLDWIWMHIILQMQNAILRRL